MAAMQTVTAEEARQIAATIGISRTEVPFDPEQFRLGLQVELEHGRRDPPTNVTDDDPIVTGKIALAYLKELPDYYDRLARMEADAGSWRGERRPDLVGSDWGSVGNGTDSSCARVDHGIRSRACRQALVARARPRYQLAGARLETTSIPAALRQIAVKIPRHLPVKVTPRDPLTGSITTETTSKSLSEKVIFAIF